MIADNFELAPFDALGIGFKRDYFQLNQPFTCYRRTPRTSGPARSRIERLKDVSTVASTWSQLGVFAARCILMPFFFDWSPKRRAWRLGVIKAAIRLLKRPAAAGVADPGPLS
jgi:hypothetical protein